MNTTDWKQNPVNLGLLFGVALIGWNTFTAGKQSGETYVTQAQLQSYREQDRAYEREQRDASEKRGQDFSNRNHDDIEKKMLASEVKTTQAVGQITSQIQLLTQKLDQWIEAHKK